ncbi:MAG: DUF7008 domain-containing protein [Actinomycetota bacterium]
MRRLQRQQLGELAVPPKYGSTDFQGGDYWRLRGKLDVPKERWLSLPHCEGMDGTLPLLWAGYNALQQAQALGGYFLDIKERQGGAGDLRLAPLLAGLMELLPWLKQWHNDLDPAYDLRMGDYYENFVLEEARDLGVTPEQVRAWDPPVRRRGRKL